MQRISSQDMVDLLLDAVCIVNADSRRIHSLLVERLPEADTTEQPAPAA